MVRKSYLFIYYRIILKNFFRQLYIISNPWVRTLLKKLVGQDAVNILGECCAVMAAKVRLYKQR